MRNNRRPSPADWVAGLLVGAVLGALVLGIGGRVAMRLFAALEGTPTSFTFEGSLTVVMLGAASGAAMAALFLLARAVFPSRRPLRIMLFCTLVALIMLRGLNPVTPLKVLVFAPLFVLHGSLLTAYWNRVRLRVTDSASIAA